MDLITLEVLRFKFDVIADEMEIALLKRAYASIVKEGMDASSALLTTGGETMAQAASIPMHLGSLVPAVQRILHEFPAQTMRVEALRHTHASDQRDGTSGKGVTMAAQQPGLTPMDLGRYYMRRMAMRVDAEHFQELCRTVAYAIEPAQTAYNLAVHYGVLDLPTPEEIWRAGTLPA